TRYSNDQYDSHGRWLNRHCDPHIDYEQRYSDEQYAIQYAWRHAFCFPSGKLDRSRRISCIVYDTPEASVFGNEPLTGSRLCFPLVIPKVDKLSQPNQNRLNINFGRSNMLKRLFRGKKDR